MFSYRNDVLLNEMVFIGFLVGTGSALMSIVGVYKEIQDQHMNIVSNCEMKIENKN